MSRTTDIPPFYSGASLSEPDLAEKRKLCEAKKQYFKTHLTEFHANTNPALLWRLIMKYKSELDSDPSKADTYSSLLMSYDGYQRMAYELLFGDAPSDVSNLSVEELEWRRKVYFSHPFLSPANFLLLSKSEDACISAVVLYAFVAKRLLLFRLRVELELVASVIPSTLTDRSRSLAESLLIGRASPSSPLSNALSQEDIEAFMLRILKNLRYARDMPRWMTPYYLCHTSRKFMFMCDIHRVGSVPIDALMKSDAFSELLHVYESDAQEAVVTFPVGCTVEIPASLSQDGAKDSDEDATFPAVVVSYEGEGSVLTDQYTVSCGGRRIKVPREQLFWSSGCTHHFSEDCADNWFFFGLVEKIYDHFVNLDADGDGVLSEDEVYLYNDSSFTKLVIQRVFEIHVPFSGARHVMDYKTYLNFVLATEYPTAQASIQYIWKILDLESTVDYIRVDTLRLFCRELAKELIHRHIMTDITADMILVELIDMVNPAWHEYVTLADIKKSGHQGILFPILLSFKNFSTYESREQLADGSGE